MRTGLTGKGEVSALWTSDKSAGKCVRGKTWVKSKAAVGVE